MAAPFPRWASTAFRIALFSIALIAIGVPSLLMIYMRTPYITNVGIPSTQPVMFDHRHHVGDDGMDCRYCHYQVEKSSYAGVPPTSLCMGCHNQIWNSSPMLQRVRESYFTGQPIPWKRVHALPDFVYFNHSIHVNKGVGCTECHGRVDQMAAVAKAGSLQMEWCLDCHRNPEPHLRPRDQITRMDWKPPPNREALGATLAAEYHVQRLVHCSACHR